MQMSCNWTDLNVDKIHCIEIEIHRVKDVHLPLILNAYMRPCDHVSVCRCLCVCLCARLGVRVCLCYLHLIWFVYIWYVQYSLQIWLTNRMNRIFFFFAFSRAMNAFVLLVFFFIQFIHLFTINIRIFYMFVGFICSAIYLSLSTIYIFAIAMGI